MVSMVSGLRSSRARTKIVVAVAVAVAAAAALVEVQSSSSQAALNSNALFVSPGGSVGASGTKSSPTTLASAVDRITPGGTIYLRGGTYDLATTVKIETDNVGTSSARKELSAYPGETPVLDFSAMSESSSNRGLAVNGSYWHVCGIVVQRAGDNGIFVGGSNNIIERTVTRYNRDTGLQISRVSSSTAKSQWPSNNLVLSAESHDNADSDGEDADGFAAKLTVGPGNVFRHAVSHHNIDDGWDLYAKSATGPIEPVTIEDSLAFENGTLSDGTTKANGDRNGYKLGGSKIKVDHVIRRSIAYRNGKHGLTYNSNPGSIKVSDNLSIDNGGRNYAFDKGSHVFRGNTSCRSTSGSHDKLSGDTDDSNQFWSGSNGSRCSSSTGALSWSHDNEGVLIVAFGDTPVVTPTTTTPDPEPTTTSDPTTTTPTGTLLSDDFEDGNADGWATAGGSWAVRANGSRVLTQSTVPGTALALTGSSTWTDQDVRATAKPTLFDGSGEYVAVLARATNTSNYYALVLRDANKVEIRRVSNGKSKVLAKTSMKARTGTTYTLRLQVRGEVLRGYVDGKLLVDTTDSTHTTGKIGLGTHDATADFDNVTVTTP